MTMRLGILASHVVQYHAPLYRELANRPDVKLSVYYCSRRGLDQYADSEFGQRVQWDIPLLDGYHSEFLADYGVAAHSRFLGHVNPGIVRRIAGKSIDVLCVQGWSRSTEWMSFAAAPAWGLPIVLRAEAHRDPVAARSGNLRRAVLSRLFRRASTFAAIGTYARSFYQSMGVAPGRIFTSPYAVDNAYFSECARQLKGKRAELKRVLGIPDVPVALFSGKLIERKRPLDLLKACERLHDPQSVAPVFVGDGPLMEEVRQYASAHRVPNVVFAGFQNQSELSRWYATADFLVLPSRYETWGLVVNEAMCFGLPVIATDGVGACPDLVQRAESGFVVPVGDVDALSASIARLVDDSVERARMSQRAVDVIEHWGLPEAADGVVAAAKAALHHD